MVNNKGKWKAEFERNGYTQKKWIRVSDAAKAVSNDTKKELTYQFLKACREADRDLAYQEHGESWREHIEYKDNFWRPDGCPPLTWE